jgi:hypothetical protein
MRYMLLELAPRRSLFRLIVLSLIIAATRNCRRSSRARLGQIRRIDIRSLWTLELFRPLERLFSDRDFVWSARTRSRPIFLLKQKLELKTDASLSIESGALHGTTR